MNDISVFIYLLCFAAVFGMTCVYMVMMMRSTMKDFNNPSRNVHPEMEGIQYGEELLVFNPEDQDDDEDDDGDIVVRT